MAGAPDAVAVGGTVSVASWNIGLRGLGKLCSTDRADEYGPPDVHGIRRKQSYGTIQAVLSAVDADIVCLQEVKLGSLGAAERRLALCDGWDSFFALSAGRKYAGVATFCRHQLRPSAVAEGLTLPLTPSPEGPRPASSHGVGEGRVPTDAAGAGLGRGNPIYLGDTGEAAVLALLPQDIIATLESEGRCLITLHGDLAVFNIYAPAVCGGAPAATPASAAAAGAGSVPLSKGSAAAPAASGPRAELKLAFLTAVEIRARALRGRGLRVCLIGDFNATADACDSAHEQESQGQGQQCSPGPSRRWLRAMLGWHGAAAPSCAHSMHGRSAPEHATAACTGNACSWAASQAPTLPPPPALAHPVRECSQPPPGLHRPGGATRPSVSSVSSVSSASSILAGKGRGSLGASQCPAAVPIVLSSVDSGDDSNTDELPAAHLSRPADPSLKDNPAWPAAHTPDDQPAWLAALPQQDHLSWPAALLQEDHLSWPADDPLGSIGRCAATMDVLSSLGTGGFADAFRLLHPRARKAYTCFHVAAGCDVANHGSRIDLALLSPPPLVEIQGAPPPVAPALMCAGEGAAGAEGDHSPRPGTTAASAVATSAAGPAAAGNAAFTATATATATASGDSAWHLLRSEILPLQGSDHHAIRLGLRGVALPAVPPGPHPVSSARRLGSQSTLRSVFARVVAGAAEPRAKGVGGGAGASAVGNAGAAAEASSVRAAGTDAVCAFASGATRVSGAGALDPSPFVPVNSYAQDFPPATATDRRPPAASAQKHPTALAGAPSPSVVAGRKGGGGKARRRDGGCTPALTAFFAPKPTAGKALASVGDPASFSPAADSAALGCASPSTARPACTLVASTPADHPAAVLGALASALGRGELARGGGGEDAPCSLGPSHSLGVLGVGPGDAWGALRRRMSAATPRCAGHGEACRLLTVKKAGVNHGREFWTCPRAEGPKARREWNCGYFLWNDEWRRRGAAAKRSRE